VQLRSEGASWKIVSLIWDVERSGNPLPSLADREELRKY
jgi:hypothetical protein